MSHEVYVAKDLYGNYLDIGAGKEGRYKHCQSGVSHCYDLNKLHHTKVKYSVEVTHTDLSKEESLEMTAGANYKRSYNGTISYIAAIFGLYAAAEVINFLIEKNE